MVKVRKRGFGWASAAKKRRTGANNRNSGVLDGEVSVAGAAPFAGKTFFLPDIVDCHKKRLAAQMLNIYISHAPGDAKYLATLLEWLKPLEERYFLRIWYNQGQRRGADLPLPWNLLLFWYTPPGSSAPFRPDPPPELEQGHIYLFLTSHHALATPHIDQVEIPAAAARYHEYGPEYVRIFPILVSPSHWKTYSRLAHFTSLGPKRTLEEMTPKEEGYREIVQQLQPIIETLRRNWMEKYQRDGLALQEFSQPAPALPPGQAVAPLPGWMGWALLALLLYSVMNWYASSCSPRMYHGDYKPLLPPEERPPQEFPRDQRVRPPAPVQLPPERDSLLLHPTE